MTTQTRRRSQGPVVLRSTPADRPVARSGKSRPRLIQQQAVRPEGAERQAVRKIDWADMPFKKVGKNRYQSPSGRIFTKKQIALYHATGGFKKPVTALTKKH